MSAEPETAVPCRSLGEYIAGLIAALEEGEPAALARLRQVVGDRCARIVLDDEAVVVRFGPAGLLIENDAGAPVDGEGSTDRTTVLALLDGYLEASEAIAGGRLEVRGAMEAGVRMMIAIEILLDSSTRIPALQRLARDFRADPCREPLQPWRGGRAHRRPGHRGAEMEILGRLGLLP